MLELENINTYYDDGHVLWDVSLNVPQGKCVAMLGRNGMGKTTIMRTISGLTPPRDGIVTFNGEPIGGLKPYQIARKGIALVPQGRGIFASLSVKENLTIGARQAEGENTWNLDEVYEHFPILEREASSTPTFSPEASSRCWLWRAHSCAIPTSCSWTSRLRDSPP